MVNVVEMGMIVALGRSTSGFNIVRSPYTCPINIAFRLMWLRSIGDIMKIFYRFFSYIDVLPGIIQFLGCPSSWHSRLSSNFRLHGRNWPSSLPFSITLSCGKHISFHLSHLIVSHCSSTLVKNSLLISSFFHKRMFNWYVSLYYELANFFLVFGWKVTLICFFHYGLNGLNNRDFY